MAGAGVTGSVVNSGNVKVELADFSAWARTAPSALSFNGNAAPLIAASSVLLASRRPQRKRPSSLSLASSQDTEPVNALTASGLVKSS